MQSITPSKRLHESDEENEVSQTKSPVWDFFKKDDLETSKKVTCILCRKQYSYTGGSTSNLVRHMKYRHPTRFGKSPATAVPGIADLLIQGRNQPKFSLETFHNQLTRWIVCNDEPFQAVENQEFIKVLTLCNPNAVPPNRDTIRRRIVQSFEKERETFIIRLKNIRGRISFSIDCWTSPNKKAFMGVTVHWIDNNWKMRSQLADFIHLEGPHSGENLGYAFIKCVWESWKN